MPNRPKTTLPEFADVDVLDGAAKAEALVFEERADALIQARLGAGVIVRALAHPGSETAKARGHLLGWRHQQLRALVRGTAGMEDVHALHKAADAIYWQIALRHDRLVHKIARHHARLSGMTAEEVYAAIVPAAYTAAILWDPSRGKYTTALSWYTMSCWQRANDRQGSVGVGDTRAARKKAFGVAEHTSLSTPVHHGHDSPGELRLNLLPAEEREGEASADTARLRRIVAALSERSRIVAEGVANGLTFREIGDTLGVSRERVRQMWVQVRAELAPAVSAPPVPTPPPRASARPKVAVVAPREREEAQCAAAK